MLFEYPHFVKYVLDSHPFSLLIKYNQFHGYSMDWFKEKMKGTHGFDNQL